MNSEQVIRFQPLHLLQTKAISPSIHVYRGSYLRTIPAHYQGNPLARETVDINVILAPGGRLVVPSRPQTTFLPFYLELMKARPSLFHQILSPSGTAKAASAVHGTPIKEITQVRLAGIQMPGEGLLYGWQALQEEAEQKESELLLLFQGNGLYYNRGSVLFDGENLYDYPNTFLAALTETDITPEFAERLAIHATGLKRPLLFFVTEASGCMKPFYFQFRAEETYQAGIQRLEKLFRQRGIQAALAASPPLVIPGPDQQPDYLRLADILSRFHANDIRHLLYCPYEGAILLSAELGREQCLRPDRLAQSLSGQPEDRLRLVMTETYNFITPAGLSQVLEQKGYANRFSWEDKAANGENVLRISPLEGVYSHLIPFLTRAGQFGLVQTSGTRGKITGNDGPTFRQLSAILQDLNAQPPFDRDPIIAAASGSQGNDVPNIVCQAKDGNADLLHHLAHSIKLDDHPAPRGMVTTPRVGIAIKK